MGPKCSDRCPEMWAHGHRGRWRGPKAEQERGDHKPRDARRCPRPPEAGERPGTGSPSASEGAGQALGRRLPASGAEGERALAV